MLAHLPTNVSIPVLTALDQNGFGVASAPVTCKVATIISLLVAGRGVGAIILKRRIYMAYAGAACFPKAPNFTPVGNCLYRELAAPVLWVYRNREGYRQRVHQKQTGLLRPVDDFDAFMFGLTDPNERGVLNGTNIMLEGLVSLENWLSAWLGRGMSLQWRLAYKR
jgi:hypothetical protein